jgi:DNA-binding response OmpR family regulator
MIRVNSQRPFVEIDGMRYTMDWKRATLAEMLLSANGQDVPFSRILMRLNTSRGSVQVYAHTLRKIFEPHGYSLVSEIGIGYRLEQPKTGDFVTCAARSFAFKQTPKTENTKRETFLLETA